MATERIACVNVDVDGLHLYHRIHGLQENNSLTKKSVYETGVLRFLDLFDSHGLKATFFLVAEDLHNQTNRDIACEIVARGHEVASHSYSHPYDLIRKTEQEMELELSQAESILQEVRGGSSVKGFRAPGYNTSPALLSLLAKRGYLYDSSFFPSPPYYLAKAAYLSMYRLLRKSSHSVLGSPRVLFAKRLPHLLHPNEAETPLVELPVTVLPGTRFPFIGTSLISGGMGGWKCMRPFLRGVPFVNLEFHAIDMTDHDIDEIDDILLKQPDQRVPLDAKTLVFNTVLEHLAHGWKNLTLEEAARIWTRPQTG
jgi:peptidoglycan/xylan/chitin deacetylase (PgdA/CDA1 family)